MSGISMENSNLSFLNSIQVDNAVIQDLSPGFYFETHFHQTAELFLCLSGQITMVMRNKKVIVNAGEYFLCFPNLPHSAISTGIESCRILQIHFLVHMEYEGCQVQSLPQTTLFNSEILLGERQHMKGACPPQFEACIRGIYNEYNYEANYTAEIIGLYLAQLNILLSRELENQQYDSSPFTNPHLLQACLYIKEHYAEHLTVGRIAEICRISTRYLSKLFHDQLRMSVCSYIAHVRIGKGIEIMNTKPDYSLINLAIDLGFSSQQHFSSVFKEIMSVSPKRYLTLHRENL